MQPCIEKMPPHHANMHDNFHSIMLFTFIKYFTTIQQSNITNHLYSVFIEIYCKTFPQQRAGYHLVVCICQYVCLCVLCVDLCARVVRVVYLCASTCACARSCARARVLRVHVSPLDTNMTCDLYWTC